MTVLSVGDVSLRFGGLQALADVSLDVNENEIVGLIGPNGAGKTTLFNCITGFYTPDSGSVRIRGQRVNDLRPDQRTALGLGRTFQHVGLVRSFTVLENLVVAQHRNVGYHIGAGLLGSPAALEEESDLEERALHVLDHLGLVHLADHPLSELNYGTLKQVEVAAALATDPSILMLDEPLAGLGPKESADFGDRLLAMRHELNLTIVVIEHHVPFVLRVCDYVYVLNFGRILAHGTADEIRGNPVVAEAYLGEGASALA